MANDKGIFFKIRKKSQPYSKVTLEPEGSRSYLGTLFRIRRKSDFTSQTLWPSKMDTPRKTFQNIPSAAALLSFLSSNPKVSNSYCNTPVIYSFRKDNLIKLTSESEVRTKYGRIRPKRFWRFFPKILVFPILVTNLPFYWQIFQPPKRNHCNGINYALYWSTCSRNFWLGGASWKTDGEAKPRGQDGVHPQAQRVQQKSLEVHPLLQGDSEEL